MGRGAAPLRSAARDERQSAVVPGDVDVLSPAVFRTALIPAAGLGTRMLPLSAGRPKALLELGGRSLLAHAIGEAHGAGLLRIVVIASPESKAVLAAEARRWATDPLVLEQPEARGLADAIRIGARALPEEPLAVLLPDNLFEPPSPLGRLVAAARATGRHAVLVARLDAERARHKGGSAPATVEPLDAAGTVRVTAVGFKQPGAPLVLSGAPQLDAPIGRYAFLPGIADDIDDVERELGPGEELDDVPLLRRLARDDRLAGVLFEAAFYDAGNPAGYREAAARLGGGYAAS